ncbi:hypothetical protein MNBD_GAMMA03-1625 [hydrothermal vent metagenome]|uniref:Uncharacterized protein n=1 Tax=hydrothermal vent metagenome TaxID=652676 RepID=A0A3B0W3F0_9ZZZZ
MMNNAAASNPRGTITGPAQTIPSLGMLGILLLLSIMIYLSRGQIKKQL